MYLYVHHLVYASKGLRPVFKNTPLVLWWGLGCRLLGGELAGRFGRFRTSSVECGGSRPGTTGLASSVGVGEPLRARAAAAGRLISFSVLTAGAGPVARSGLHDGSLGKGVYLSWVLPKGLSTMSARIRKLRCKGMQSVALTPEGYNVVWVKLREQWGDIHITSHNSSKLKGNIQQTDFRHLLVNFKVPKRILRSKVRNTSVKNRND